MTLAAPLTRDAAIAGLRSRTVAVLRAMLALDRRKKRGLVFLLDFILCIAAVFIAFSLRVGALAFPIHPPLLFCAVAIPIFVGVFLAFRLYSTIFRFVGSRTIGQIATAVTVYSLPIMAIFLLWGVENIPRTVAIIQPMIFFGFVATSRIMIRAVLIDLMSSRLGSHSANRVLIYGAGAAGRQLLLSLRHDAQTMPIAFIDDDDRLDQQLIDGVRVHRREALANVIVKYDIEAVLLALPNINRKRRSEIVDSLRALHVRVQTLPNIQELMDGTISVSDLREIQIEDLLGRDPVTANELLLGRTIVGKTIVVTGAGGSIGSELCRQILRCGPSRLILFDVSEFALYQIEREISALCTAGGLRVEIVPVLGSVTDRERVDAVLSRWQPDTVYHAAAYKHVPLVEANVVEGIRNNVLGTGNVIQAAEASSVRDFILISTDKAVRPTSVMGATKRAAEQLVQVAAERSTTCRFSMVRFGNVLGSSGSVVPLFRRQIEAGGPVTVTHRDVTRYFMTIPEAAQLVLQAGGMARGGDVFVLDMGEPVRIMDLARAMIQLSGLSVRDEANLDGDVEIVEVGMRPGEKLFEELLIGNSPEPTLHPRILKAHEDRLSVDELASILSSLRTTKARGDAIHLLRRMVPEYEPDNERGSGALLGVADK